MKFAKVPGVPGKLHSQSPCHHRLRLACVGAFVTPAVPAVDLPRPPSAFPRKKCSCQHEQRRQPGRHIIHHIVQPGRGRAKILIPVIAIADHRVHGVHRFIEKSAGGAKQHQVEQGRHHPVGSIFRHGLHRRFDHSFFRQALGIPSHDPGDRPAAFLHSAGLQRLVHPVAFHLQGTGGQKLITEEGLQKKPQREKGPVSQKEDPRRDPGTEKDHQDRQDPSPQTFKELRSGQRSSDNWFQSLDQPPHKPHRMIRPHRISQRKVQEESAGHRQQHLQV